MATPEDVSTSVHRWQDGERDLGDDVRARRKGSSVTAGRAAPDSDSGFLRRRGVRLVPGLALTGAITALATWLGTLAPLVGAPVFGILIGVAIALFLPAGSMIEAGARFAGTRVLQGSVVLLGTGLSLAQVARVGIGSLPVMLGTLAVALLGAWGIGLLLRVDGDIRTLVGVGTGICGASAIAATTAVIGAAEADVAYAIGTIFTFNIAAVLLFPAIGHLLGLSQHAFGLWAGTAVNDTSSVVAAGYTYGSAAGSYAVIVKLTRTLMIIPITLVLSLLTARRSADTKTAVHTDAADAVPTVRMEAALTAQSEATLTAQTTEARAAQKDAAAAPQTGGAPAAQTAAVPTAQTGEAAAPQTEGTPAARRRSFPWRSIVPVFIVGFLAASALDTVGAIPDAWHPALSSVGVVMITMALAGIGLGTRVATLRAAGVRPLLLGGILWVLVAASSLLLQWTGTL